MRNVNRFRRWILFPLLSAFVFGSGLNAYKRHWFEAAVLLAVAFLLYVVERSLKWQSTVKSGAGRERVQEYIDPAGGASEIESQILTRALIFSTLTLSIATVLLAIYSAVDVWWVAGLKGLCIAVFYPFVSILILIRMPHMFVKNNIDLPFSILPRSIDCPHCSANMLLDEQERITKIFMCPGCDMKIDLRELRTVKMPS